MAQTAMGIQTDRALNVSQGYSSAVERSSPAAHNGTVDASTCAAVPSGIASAGPAISKLKSVAREAASQVRDHRSEVYAFDGDDGPGTGITTTKQGRKSGGRLVAKAQTQQPAAPVVRAPKEAGTSSKTNLKPLTKRKVPTALERLLIKRRKALNETGLSDPVDDALQKLEPKFLEATNASLRTSKASKRVDEATHQLEVPRITEAEENVSATPIDQLKQMQPAQIAADGPTKGGLTGVGASQQDPLFISDDAESTSELDDPPLDMDELPTQTAHKELTGEAELPQTPAAFPSSPPFMASRANKSTIISFSKSGPRNQGSVYGIVSARETDLLSHFSLPPTNIPFAPDVRSIRGKLEAQGDNARSSTAASARTARLVRASEPSNVADTVEDALAGILNPHSKPKTTFADDVTYQSASTPGPPDVQPTFAQTNELQDGDTLRLNVPIPGPPKSLEQSMDALSPPSASVQHDLDRPSHILCDDDYTNIEDLEGDTLVNLESPPVYHSATKANARLTESQQAMPPPQAKKLREMYAAVSSIFEIDEPPSNQKFTLKRNAEPDPLFERATKRKKGGTRDKFTLKRTAELEPSSEHAAKRRKGKFGAVEKLHPTTTKKRYATLHALEDRAAKRTKLVNSSAEYAQALDSSSIEQATQPPKPAPKNDKPPAADGAKSVANEKRKQPAAQDSLDTRSMNHPRGVIEDLHHAESPIPETERPHMQAACALIQSSKKAYEDQEPEASISLPNSHALENSGHGNFRPPSPSLITESAKDTIGYLTAQQRNKKERQSQGSQTVDILGSPVPPHMEVPGISTALEVYSANANIDSEDVDKILEQERAQRGALEISKQTSSQTRRAFNLPASQQRGFLSSNSKVMPASPHAESQVVSGLSLTCPDANRYLAKADVLSSMDDPFTSSSLDPPASTKRSRFSTRLVQGAEPSEHARANARPTGLGIGANTLSYAKGPQVATTTTTTTEHAHMKAGPVGPGISADAVSNPRSAQVARTAEQARTNAGLSSPGIGANVVTTDPRPEYYRMLWSGTLPAAEQARRRANPVSDPTSPLYGRLPSFRLPKLAPNEDGYVDPNPVPGARQPLHTVLQPHAAANRDLRSGAIRKEPSDHSNAVPGRRGPSNAMPPPSASAAASMHLERAATRPVPANGTNPISSISRSLHVMLQPGVSPGSTWGSTISSNSTQPDPATVDLMTWRNALKPHQASIFDELLNAAHRLTQSLVDVEAAEERLVQDVVKRVLRIIEVDGRNGRN